MNSLFVYLDENAAFDRTRVEQALQRIGTLEGPATRTDEGLVEWTSTVGGDQVTGWLHRDDMGIGLRGSGEAAKAFVVAFRREYGQDMHFVDDNYSFDVVLDGTHTVEDLGRILEPSSE